MKHAQTIVSLRFPRGNKALPRVLRELLRAYVSAARWSWLSFQRYRTRVNFYCVNLFRSRGRRRLDILHEARDEQDVRRINDGIVKNPDGEASRRDERTRGEEDLAREIAR